MTFWELAHLLVRYWLVVFVGALCTMGVGLVAIHEDGVYFSRAELIFLAPASSLYPNALQTQSEDVIDTAGIVAKRVSGPGRVTKFTSPDVTLADLGVRDGWSLRLPDTGGQWASNFISQVLLVDVVGPSPEAVQSQRAELVQRVGDELFQLQRNAGVNPVNEITVIPAPDVPAVYYVAGRRYRTLVMTAMLGIGVTAAVVLSLDRHRRRRAASLGLAQFPVAPAPGVA